MRWWLAPLTVAALLALAGGGIAQTYTWSEGDIQIAGAHPDLAPQDDGKIHSDGDYFSQLLLRGSDASQVEEIGFSFGVGPPSPQHYPGYAGLWDFRTDATPEDGWMIPLTSSDTPDGEYRFAVHAYANAGDPSSEIARFWGAAVVENEDGDDIGPWPWILPGETSQPTNPHGVSGVTIEFAEQAEAQLWVDGREVQLTNWTPPPRDDDEIPRHTVDSESRVLGSGYKWEGALETETVLRVEAVDEAGNRVTKGALVGVGIDNPVVEVQLPDTPPAPGPDGETEATVEVANIGLRTGNVTLSTQAPDGVSAQLEPAEVTLNPGASKEVTLTMTREDRADVNLSASQVGVEAAYEADGQPVSSTFRTPLTEPGGDAIQPAGAGPAGDPGGTDEQEGIPGFSPLALVAAVMLAAARSGRRH